MFRIKIKSFENDKDIDIYSLKGFSEYGVKKHVAKRGKINFCGSTEALGTRKDVRTKKVKEESEQRGKVILI